jgi:hypothetical protein
MSRFDLTVVLERHESHCKLIKVFNPTLRLETVAGCPVGAAVCRFLEEFDNVQLHKVLVSARGLDPAPRQSAAKAAGYPRLLYFWDNEHRAVELPKLHDGARPETLRRRLCERFTRKVKRLRPHQRDVHAALADRNFQRRHAPAFLLYWQMGSGKTLAATSLMVNKRSAYNCVVCSNSNLGYWVKTIQATPFITQEEVAALEKTKRARSRRDDDDDDEAPELASQFHRADRDVALWFEVVGYTAFRATFDRPSALKNYTCVVVDEAHYFRNHTSAMQSALAAVHSARNLLLLSGTPLVNDASDVVGLLALADTDRVGRWQEAQARGKPPPSPTKVRAFWQRNVSYFNPQRHRPNMFKRYYPTTEMSTVRVPMHWVQTLEYMRARQQRFKIGNWEIQGCRANRYNCLTRAICNAASDGSSPKLDAVLANLARHLPEGPQLCHSSLVETGVAVLADKCAAELPKARVAMITGKTPTAERERIRKQYNTRKVDVLMISDASQFGLDLLGTVAVHLMEPHANLATEQQTTARAIRMGSHRGCATAQVQVYKYVSVFPVGRPTKAAIKQCAARLIEMAGAPEIAEEVDVLAEVKRMMRDEEQGITINERQAHDNDRKAAEIAPYADAIARSSVKMTKQAGAKLFAQLPGTEARR